MAAGTENNPLGGTNPHGHFIQLATMGQGILRSSSKCAGAIQIMAPRRKWNLTMKGKLDSFNPVSSSTSQGCLPGPYRLKSFQAIPCNGHALITPKMDQCSMPRPGAEHAATCCPHAVAMHCLLEKKGTPARTLGALAWGRACPWSIRSLAGEHFWKRSSPAR